MTITRANINIELTAHELHMAYLEEQQNLREAAFQGELDAHSITYTDKKLYQKAFSLYNALIEKEEEHPEAYEKAVKILEGGNSYEII